MNAYPYQIAPQEPTKKQVWFAALTALLGHLLPDEAVAAADRALELCDERWREPEFVADWKYKHDFPVGHAFPNPLRSDDVDVTLTVNL